VISSEIRPTKAVEVEEEVSDFFSPTQSLLHADFLRGATLPRRAAAGTVPPGGGAHGFWLVIPSWLNLVAAKLTVNSSVQPFPAVADETLSIVQVDAGPDDVRAPAAERITLTFRSSYIAKSRLL
jgi:hypothetical protein